MESNLTITESDKHFDDAFIEDSDQSSTILDHSSEAVTDKSLRRLNNSSIATKEKIAADCPDILHWPLEDINSINCSELSTENFCLWEMAGITPKSTEKRVHETAKQAILMDYSTTAMSPPGLKESPSTISVAPKNCSVKVRDILLTYTDSPSKKAGGFSSSPSSAAFGAIISGNIPQSQPLGAENDTVNTDNRCERKVNSFCGKKLLKVRTRSVKKRAWKETDVPKKRICLDPSITVVPQVSLKDSSSRILSDSNEGLITNKSLLTSVALPNSSPTQNLPLNSLLETNNDSVNTESWLRNKRILGPASEQKLVAEGLKDVKKWTKNVLSRKRKHIGQLVDETFALSQPLPENETCVVKFPLHSDETVCPSPVKNVLICNKTIQIDDVTSWPAPSVSDINLQLISSDLSSSNSKGNKQNCLWEMYSGEKLLSPQNSKSMLANEATQPSNDENAVLADELKNWEPFSTDVLSKTVGAMTEDTEMAVQDTEASDANLARTQLLSDQLKPAKKKKGRRSMSADREIANQMMEIICSEISDSSVAFPYKRYPQRPRRRSTEPIQFTQIEAFSDLAKASATVPNEGSRPEPGIPTAGNETEIHLVSESLAKVEDLKLGFESTARSGDELALDFDASNLESDFNLYPVRAKSSHRLRRKSTELYRLSQNNQRQLLASLEEMPEQQESTASQKAENDIVNADCRGKQKGVNQNSRRPKQKKGKAEEGPPLEDIYLNRLWRSQMPKDVSWETIPEDPKYNKDTGDLRLFSVRKAKRFLDFDEGPSPLRLKKRKLKARQNGWKPLTKKKDLALSKLLEQKLSQLDAEIGVSEAHV